MPQSQLRVAIAQARVPSDLPSALDRIEAEARAAANEGVKVLSFGETWVGGYPIWLDYCPGAALWGHEPTQAVFERLRENSLVIPSNESARLARLAGELGLTLVLGVNERVDSGPGRGTLYNSLLTFGPEGTLRNHHRKLVPTYTEKLIWGQGDADGLRVIKTPEARIGGLICWEHWMPLPRQVMHDQAEDIHIAVWPEVSEAHQLGSRHYAFEGRCFVLASGLIARVEDLPPELPPLPELADDPQRLLKRGGSAVIGPNGNYLAGPLFDEERLLIADLDLKAIDRESMTLDVSGHYARPELFSLHVAQGRRFTPVSNPASRATDRC